jgi:hypothetical protein
LATYILSRAEYDSGGYKWEVDMDESLDIV